MAENRQSQEQAEQLQQLQQMMRAREELLMRNHAELSGVVVEIEELPKSEKKDRKGVLITDENGTPTFWDPMFKVVVNTFGGEEFLYLDATLVQHLEPNRPYHFVGRIKDRKFKVTAANVI